MITIITVLLILAIPLGIFFYREGYFGIVVEVDYNRGCIYFWYKGNIIISKYFHLDYDVDKIVALKIKGLEEAKNKLIKLKELKSKL
jgi:hypothetical protein